MLLFTKMIVAHHNMISVYDIVNKQWKDEHFAFEAPVISIFRFNINHDKNFFEIGILLKNNTIRKLQAKMSESKDLMIKVMFDSPIKLPGQIMNYCFDK
jgi:hypothetical protein